MFDLRTISLSSFLYKIVAKIMVWGPKPILSEIISDTQSAFIEEKLITYDISIVHEVIQKFVHQWHILFKVRGHKIWYVISL